MDWGMLQWDKERGCWRLSMREQRLISPRMSVYFLLALFNFALRFLWAMAVFGAMPTRGHGMFFFEAMEIARRTVWAVFRIEWEYVAKVLPRGSGLAGYSVVDKDTISESGEDASLLHAERSASAHEMISVLVSSPKDKAGARPSSHTGTVSADTDL